MTNSAPEFDPRYDPRFQPGYDPERHASRLEVPSESRHAERRVPAPPRAAEGGRARQAASGDDDIAIFEADDLTADAVELAEREDEQEDAAPRRLGPVAVLVRNPFVWLILIVGIGLIWWGWTSYADTMRETMTGLSWGSNDDEAANQYVNMQVTWALAPLAAFTGMLTLCGVGFFAAATWWRVRADREPQR